MLIKDISLAKRLGFGFGAILLIIITNTVISSVYFANVKTSVTATEQEKLPYALLADTIAFDTLKVQQLLVQSAASFSTEGVREAEKTMTEIRNHLAKFRALAKGRNNTAAIKGIDELEGTFTQFHEKGKQMAEVYVSQGGIDAAGKLLNEFDKSSRMLSERVLALQKEYVDDAKSNINGVADTVSTVQNLMFVLTGIALLVSGLIAYLITVSITGPLNEAVSLANQIAEGDLRAADIKVTSSDETGRLGAALNKMKEALREVIAGVDKGAGLIASSSGELSTTVQRMTSRAEDQAGKAGQVAASSTQMSQQIAGVANNAAVMMSLAKEALVVANSGAEVVKETAAETHAMSDAVSDLSQLVSSLDQRSKQIGNIVGVIKDVASQTNLLALNAAIEAARAGEQGRGFAVVADEVRKLAERTSSSTTEIDEMIKAIQVEMANAMVSMENSTVRVGNGVRLAMQAGDSLNRIVSTIKNLQTTVEETASSTEEMANAASQISADIVDVASVSKETSSHAGAMEQESGKLAKLSDELISTVSKFRS